MFCNQCGEILRENATRCPVCGAAQKKTNTRINDACDCGTNKTFPSQAARPQTHSTAPGGKWSGKTFRYIPGRSRPAAYSTVEPEDRRSVSWFGFIKDFFRKGLDFRSRSCRREFWLTYLFIFLVTVLLADILTACILWFLVMIVPFTALGVRRLHDIGKSGWWLLIKLIPVAGVILLILWFCKPSQRRTNPWGQCPIPY